MSLLGIGIAFIVIGLQSRKDPNYAKIWMAFVSCSASLTVLVTALISGRLLHARWRIAKALGVPFWDSRSKENGGLTSASAILIESAAPLAVLAIAEVIMEDLMAKSTVNNTIRIYYADCVINVLYASFMVS